MAKWNIEIDTDNISSVLGTYLMLGRLLEFWKNSLKVADTEKIKNDNKPVQQVTQESQPEVTP